jgi:hypothetical protein
VEAGALLDARLMVAACSYQVELSSAAAQIVAVAADGQRNVWQ